MVFPFSDLSFIPLNHCPDPPYLSILAADIQTVHANLPKNGKPSIYCSGTCPSLCLSLNKSQLQAPAIQNVHNFLWRGFGPLKKGSLIKAHGNRLFVNVLTFFRA